MALSAEFIRALAGLSEAEMPDTTIEVLQVISIAEAYSASITFSSPEKQLYYEGYKAILILGPSLYNSLATSIKDNFNGFTRELKIDELLDTARGYVKEIESPTLEVTADNSLLSVISPTIDPVKGEGRL